MQHTQAADLQARLAALERSLADLTAAGVGEAALAGLEQQAAAIRQQLSGTGLQVGHDQTVQGDIVQRDKIDRQTNPHGEYVEGDVTVIGAQAAERFLGSLRPQLSKDALRQATTAYFQALLDRHLYLNMKGMGVADRVPLRLPLLDVYVPLKARLELPEGETWRRESTLAGRALSAPEDSARDDSVPKIRMSEPVAVLELLQKHNGLIILGHPGAGKTTFLNSWRCNWHRARAPI